MLEWVRYPDWLWPRLQDAMGAVVQAGFDTQKRRIIDRIYGRPVSIYAPAPPPTPPSAAEAMPVPDAARPAIVIRERETVYPRTAIDTYTANRIPPLRHEITERRRLLCRDIVRDGIGRGDGVRPIMQDLRDNGFGMSEWHRETIARTEAATLFSHGQMAEMMESPSVVGFRFFAVIDDRTTETCAYLDGKEFLKGDADGVYPPLHHNCRSTIEEVFLWDKQPKWQTPEDVLSGAAKAQRPLPGFGHVDYDSLPREATAEDLYRTLNQSERAQAIRFADELAARAQSISRAAVRETVAVDTARAVEFTDIAHTSVAEIWDEQSRWKELLDSEDVVESPEKTKARIATNLATRLADDPDWQVFLKSEDGMKWREVGRALDENMTIDEQVVSGILHQWAGESGDGNPLSVLLQACAREEFGAEMAGQSLTAHFAANAEEIIEAARARNAVAGIRKCLREMYNQTQQYLSERGVDYVTLYRGAHFSEIPKGSTYVFREVGEELVAEFGKVQFQPLSSFSTSVNGAGSFARTFHHNTVVAVRVPRERIMSTAQTGFGCKDEAEMVVLGGVEDCRAVAWNGYWRGLGLKDKEGKELARALLRLGTE